MKTTSSVLSLAASAVFFLTFCPQSFASILIDSMNEVGNWQIGGGSNSQNRTLARDTTIKTEGTASIQATANYVAAGSAYTDVYQNLSPSYDFSANTFTLSYRTTNVKAKLVWRLGSSLGPVYEASYTPISANTWETVSFTVANFTSTPSNLASVNLIQLRVIGDELGAGNYPQYVTTNFDNMQIVPEPSTWILLGASLGAVLLLRVRRARVA